MKVELIVVGAVAQQYSTVSVARTVFSGGGPFWCWFFGGQLFLSENRSMDQLRRLEVDDDWGWCAPGLLVQQVR